MRTENDVKNEMAEVAAARLRLVGRSFRLKMLMLKPITKFVEPLLQFAHTLGQKDMAEWILDGPDAPPGYIDGMVQQEALRKEVERDARR